MYEIRVETGLGWPEKLRAAWQELADDSPTATLYQTWEWQSTWWRYYRGSRRPFILQVFDGPKLVGLYPLTRSTGLWRAVKPMGKGPSCFLHPLARAGHEEAVAGVLAEFFQTSREFDYLDLSMLRSTEPLAQKLPADRVYEQFVCHAIRLPETWDELRKGLPQKFRQKLNHFDRRDWRYEGCTVRRLTGDSVERGMELLYDLSNRRWQGRTSNVAFESTRMRSLYSEWSRLAEARGWLRLTTLEIDGSPIGVLMAAKIGKNCFFQMQGFRPEHHALSPGMVLTADTVRWAIEQQCELFEFMIGNEGYKHHWNPNNTHRLMGCKLVVPGVRGRMADRWYKAGVWALGQVSSLRWKLRRRQREATSV